MTLIEERTCDSLIKRRCTAGCYNAKGKRCKCICGGKNHSMGYCKELIKQTELVLLEKGRMDGNKFYRYPLLDMDQRFLF